MTDALTSSDFSKHLNTCFTIRLDTGEQYELHLASVDDIGDCADIPGRRPFSLQFTNPRKDVFLQQRTYRLGHPVMGALDIFIVPLGPAESGMRYEAIFY